MPRADIGPRPCLVAYRRTPFANAGGALAAADPTLLAAATLSACLADARQGPGALAGAVYGNVYPAGLGQHPARRVLTHLACSGGPGAEALFGVPALAVNSVCNSSGEAVLGAVRRILCGEGELYAAGGFESMSRAAGLAVPAPGPGGLRGAPGERGCGPATAMALDGLTDSLTGLSMGALADRALGPWVSRERADEYARRSYERRLAYLRGLGTRGERDPAVIGLYVGEGEGGEGGVPGESGGPGSAGAGGAPGPVKPAEAGKVGKTAGDPAARLSARNLIYSTAGGLYWLSGERVGDAAGGAAGGAGVGARSEWDLGADSPTGAGANTPAPTPLLLADTQLARYLPAKLATLRPCFSPSGPHTAATSSAPCDGAATLLLASRALADAAGLPASELVAYSSVACAPEDYALAPAAAAREVLGLAGLGSGDVARYRVNEAFAGVPLLCADRLGIDQARLNSTGDALAIGHPLGVSSCRGLGDVHNELAPGEYGVAAACNGGGGAVAFLVRRIR